MLWNRVSMCVCASNPFAALLQVDNLSQEGTNLLLLS